jgi:hypothetical protein
MANVTGSKDSVAQIKLENQRRRNNPEETKEEESAAMANNDKKKQRHEKKKLDARALVSLFTTSWTSLICSVMLNSP